MNARTRAAVVAIAAALLAACGGREAGDAATPRPVRVTAVETAPAGGQLRAIGIVAPADEVRLSFTSAGVVAAVTVTQGQRVTRGQLLATLVQDEIAATETRARALADKAARDLERGRSLYTAEVATREQLEDLETAKAVADAGLAAARFNARHARIASPADGLVLRRLAEPGELVAAGQPVLVVGGTAGGWVVRAALSDRDIVRLEPGARAEVTMDAHPGRRFTAVATEFAAAADPRTGTYEVEFTLDPDGARLVQGLVAKLVVATGDAAEVPVVPVAALLEADGRDASVFVVAADGTVARQVPVRIGRLVDERVEVLDGLAPGDRVVTEGATWLRDGAAVRVLDGR